MRKLALCLLVFLTACSQVDTPASPAGVKIETGQTDTRGYRYFELDNGMKALVISDPETTKSAASLNVATGSYEDPKDREGLAHFLEHMLFLGTEKYPEGGEYNEYLDSNGGSHNAYTAYELTNYHFSVNSTAYEGALDRFAQFFIAPLFTAEFVDREKGAVHSEYFTRINKDQIRRMEVIEGEMNPNHPAWKFNAGNLSTLKDHEDELLRDALIKFYQTYYSSDQMTVVLLGNESLDQLEALARSKFSAVPTIKNVPETQFGPMYAKGELPKVIEIQPVQEQRSLSLTFPMPSFKENYREKPMNFVAGLVGHEGSGSLHDDLKARGWIESLSAGPGMNYGGNDTFYVGVGLTPVGMEHQDEIIAAVFDQVKLAREQGIEKWRFDEMSNLSESSFRFKEKGAIMQYVISLANNLQVYAPQDVVRGPGMLVNYDESLIKQVFDHIRVDNMLVTLMAPGVETDKVTRFYDSSYRVYQPTAERVASWSKPQVTGLVLAKANPFIPESLELISATHVEKPVNLADTGSVDLWHYPNTSFGVPKVSVSIALDRPGTLSAHQDAVESLYFALMGEQLNEIKNYTSQAGVGFGVSGGDKGARISFGGFSDKLMVLADAILPELQKPEFTQQQFDRIKMAYLRNIRNYSLQAPYQRLGNDLKTLMDADSITTEEFGAALAKVTPDDVRNAPAALFRNVRMQMMASGNVTEQQARELAEKVYTTLNLTDAKEEVALGSRILKLEPSAERGIYLKQLGHMDAGVVRYYQGRDNSREERARLSLLGKMLHQPYFHQLRTLQQLGYVVGARSASYDRVPGLRLLVQSPTVDVNAVEAANDAFLPTFKDFLDGMTDEQFAQHRQAMVIQLKEKPKNLGEQVGRFWGGFGLRGGYPEFDGREKFIKAVEAITLADMRNAYQQVVLSAPRSVSVVAPGKKGGVEGTIASPAEFRTGKEVYVRD